MPYERRSSRPHPSLRDGWGTPAGIDRIYKINRMIQVRSSAMRPNCTGAMDFGRNLIIGSPTSKGGGPPGIRIDTKTAP